MNIGNPSAMAYNGRAALWASPRLTAANSSLAPSSIQPPLSVLVQRGKDGGNLLHVGALSLKLSKNLAFLAVSTIGDWLVPNHCQDIAHVNLLCHSVVRHVLITKPFRI